MCDKGTGWTGSLASESVLFQPTQNVRAHETSGWSGYIATNQKWSLSYKCESLVTVQIATNTATAPAVHNFQSNCFQTHYLWPGGKISFQNFPPGGMSQAPQQEQALHAAECDSHTMQATGDPNFIIIIMVANVHDKII